MAKARGLCIAPGFHLPLESVTQSFGTLGKRGSGKTNAARVLAEEMFAADLPFVVIDPIGSWWGLRAGRDGKKGGIEIPIFGGRHGDLPLERNAGAFLADLIARDRLSCVIDTTGFEIEADKLRFLSDFGDRLYRKNEDPLHVFMEEVDDYAPQKPNALQSKCLQVFQVIVRRGRARGLGVSMLTQRSAVVNKDLLTQIETLFVFRTTAPQDLKAIEGWVRYHAIGDEVLSTLSALKDGEAWVWSPHFLGEMKRIRFRLSTTFDSGATPTGATKKAATLADVDLDDLRGHMAEAIERAKADDPALLRQEIARLKAAAAKKAPPAPAAPAKAKVEVREVPGLTMAQLKAFDVQIRRLEAAGEKQKEAFDAMRGVLVEMTSRLAAIANTRYALAVERTKEENARLAATADRRALPPAPKPVVEGVLRASGIGNAGGAGRRDKGETLILRAIVQTGDRGLAQRSLTTLTTLKKASVRTYLARLVGGGLVERRGDRIHATPAGISAAGEFEALPKGKALLDHWRSKLTGGEKAIFDLVVDRYPNPVDRQAGALLDLMLTPASIRTYIARLVSREVLEPVGKGAVRAAEVLFQ